jgi:hypothetical protein
MGSVGSRNMRTCHYIAPTFRDCLFSQNQDFPNNRNFDNSDWKMQWYQSQASELAGYEFDSTINRFRSQHIERFLPMSAIFGRLWEIAELGSSKLFEMERILNASIDSSLTCRYRPSCTIEQSNVVHGSWTRKIETWREITDDIIQSFCMRVDSMDWMVNELKKFSYLRSKIFDELCANYVAQFHNSWGKITANSEMKMA